MTRAWAFLLVTIGLAMAVMQLTNIRTDIGDFFFSGDANDTGLLAGQLQSDELARRYLISIAHPGIDSTTVREFVAALQQALAESEQVRRVWTDPFSQTDILQLLRFYAPHQLHLLSLHDKCKNKTSLSTTIFILFLSTMVG